jgi:uncharacterized protein (TIGR02284 family)
MNTKESIEALNSLIEINNDRIEGYKTASNETNENDMQTLFAECIQTSQDCKAALVREVHTMGGTPLEGTTTSGKFYRVLMDVKVAVTVNDRKTILESCDFGEGVAADTYDKAIKNSAGVMNPDQLALIHAHQVLLQADRDNIKTLRAIVPK